MLYNTYLPKDDLKDYSIKWIIKTPKNHVPFSKNVNKDVGLSKEN